MRTADLVVVGAGVVGLAIARAALAAEPSLRIEVVDKEPAVAAHGSGRNSGVLHSGVYYAEGTLKARFCRDGNAAWRAWCADKRVPVRSCGKVIVARSLSEQAGLEELARRADAGGVRVEWLDEAQLAEVEPRARTVGKALFSPDTGSVDPRRVMTELAGELAAKGVRLTLGKAFHGRTGEVLDIGGERVTASHVVNAAGLHADVVAREFGAGGRFRLLPFRGLYLYADASAAPFRTHVYPVPDLTMPFLGVHVTLTVDGKAKLGPTAMPALWREQYGGLSGFSAEEAARIGLGHLQLLATDASARRLGAAEIAKLSAQRLIEGARGLVPDLDPARWKQWGRPGIRAQLVDTHTGRLHMDFAVEDAERSTHVLNAISPAFSCALPFGEYVVAHHLRGTVL